jgi:peptide/nickel transport system permease protein
VVVTLISISVFALFWYGPRSPASPLCQQENGGRACPQSRVEEYAERMGFNDPMFEQYGAWAKGVFFGRDLPVGRNHYQCDAPCLGVNYRNKHFIWDEFKQKYPASLSVAVGAAAIYLVVGVAVGVMAARRRGTLADRALVTATLFMSSIPYYLVALLAFIYFTIIWKVFGSTGYHPITDNPLKWFSGLLLPWLVLGLYTSTSYTRFSRGSMVETLNEDYIRTARAKGLSERTVVMKHALRAAVVPVVTIFGLDFATLLAGTIFTERIFGIDGIGQWALTATYQRNLPVVSTAALLASFVVVAANLAVDIVYSVLDPRVRLT